MNASLRQWLNIYQYLAGICDAGSGLLLIGFPGFTLGLVGLTLVSVPLTRFIGVFVFAVGLSYLWAVIRWPLNVHSVQVWLTQWKLTAAVRSLVALFLLWQVAAHAVEYRWLTIAVFDGLLAVIQVIGVDQGWIERAA